LAWWPSSPVSASRSAQRIERAAGESGISVERAAKRQKREDQVRADMSLQLYGWDPRDTERYDLVVNTGTMDPARLRSPFARP
jgi:cytidylate kinase